MLFDFFGFIEELRGNREKAFIVEDYEKSFKMSFYALSHNLVTNVETDAIINRLPFYREYIGKFQVINLKVPQELQNDFDWDLLVQLVASSFSSEVELEYDSSTGTTEMLITVVSNNNRVTKSISELWSFQILRLYEIYMEEQLKLATLHNDDINECVSIDSDRKKRIQLWDQKLTELQNKQSIISVCEKIEDSISNVENIFCLGVDKESYYYDIPQKKKGE